MKLISCVAAGSVAGWGAARLAGADQIRRLEAPAAPLMSFTPHVTAAALLGSVVLRRRGAATTAGLTGAALAAVVLQRAIRRPQPQAAGPVLRGGGRRPRPAAGGRRAVSPGAHRRRGDPARAGRAERPAPAHDDRRQ